MTATVPTSSEFNDQVLRINVNEEAISKLDARLKKLEDAAIPSPTPTTEYPLAINQNTKDGKWRCKYLGSGKVFATDNPAGFHMIPKAATGTTDSSGVGYETYACEVLTTSAYQNFTLDFDATTIKQLRTNKTPNPWEAWWVFFRFTDEDPKSNHHYYFYLNIGDHPVFGKKDNPPGDNTLEQQLYLPRLSETPKGVVGTKNHVTVTANNYKFVISVDGTKIVDYTDTPKDPTKMAKGLIGFYCEDAEIKIENIKIV
jgi:hypothetical protein